MQGRDPTAAPRGLLAACAACALVLGLPSAPASAQVGLRVTRLDEQGAVRVDGDLRDWEAVGVRWVRAGGTGDPSFRFALAYDTRGLYVGAAVRDARLVRERDPGQSQDALLLTLVTPERRGLRGLDVWLFPGIAGRLAAAARLGAVDGRGGLRAAPGVRVVEGPSPEPAAGFAIEAFVPWSAIPGSARWQEGRAALRYRDVDEEAHPELAALVGTSDVDPSRLELLPELRPTGGESAVLQSFLRARGLEAAPHRFDLRGDVGGDERPERVVVVDRFVVVFGPGHRGGQGFDFVALPVRSGADVRSAELEDLTGDGVAELVLVYRIRDDVGSHDVWRVYDPESGGVTPLVGVEVRREVDGAAVDMPVTVGAARGGPPTLAVRAASAPPEALPPARLEPGVAPILVVGGGVRSRTWRWNGRAFDVIEEVPEPPPAEPARTGREANAAREAQAAREPSAPVFDAAAAEAMARRRAGVSADARPTHRRRANVFGDSRPEEVVVFGSALFIWGPGYRDGTSVFHLSLGDDPRNVLELETADLTGDGVDEVLLRRRDVRPTDRGDVVREVLTVYRLTEDAFPRLLAVEVARALDPWRVEAEVRIRGRGRNRALEVRPGRARNVDASTWPFGPEPADVDPRPIPLPWRDDAGVYRWDGRRLVPR